MKWKHLFIGLCFVANFSKAQNNNKPNPFQPEIDAFAKADKDVRDIRERMLND